MSDLVRVIKGASFQPQTTNPLVEAGDVYFDANTLQFFFFDGVSTVPFGGVAPFIGTPSPVAATGNPGSVTPYAKGDHAHEGVHSINSVLGDAVLVGGNGISVTPVGQNITIDATAAFQPEFDAGMVTSPTVLIDWDNGQAQRLTLANTCTISLVNGVVGTWYTLKLFQNIHGPFVVSFGSNVIWKNDTYPGNTRVVYTNDVFYFNLTTDGTYLAVDERNYLALQYNGAKDIAHTTISGPNRSLNSFVMYDNDVWHPWGFGPSGQLGLNGPSHITGPHQSSFISGRSFSILTCRDASVAAIETSTGHAYCWGSGNVGQIGDNTLEARSSPKSVLGGRSFKAIACLGDTVHAIEGSTGFLWGWGSGASGRLGTNDLINRSSPVSVVGGRSYSKVAAGSSVGFGIEGSTGNIYGWGLNFSGVLGDNTGADRNSPTSVVGGKSFVEVSSGLQTITAAIEGSTGNMFSWGNNANGALGDNTILNRSSPVSVVGGRSFRKVSVGHLIESNSAFTVAIEGSTGNIYHWGVYNDGINFFGRSSPVLIGTRSYVKIATSSSTFTAIEADSGAIHLWGLSSGIAGILSYPQAWQGPTATTPTQVNPILISNRKWSEIGFDAARTIAIESSTGLLYAWGFDWLGDNTTNGKSAPISVLGGRSYSKVVSTANGSCAIQGSTGNAYAWGNQCGGDNTIQNRSSPTSVAGGRSYSQIATIPGTGFALIEGATGRVWSYAPFPVTGVLGDGTVQGRSSPVSLLGGRSFRRISGHANTMAGIEGSTGFAWAWGGNAFGQIGDNTIINRSSPVSVVGGRRWSDIGGGSGMYCAIEASTGNAYAWGDGSNGKLGNNLPLAPRSSPTSVVGGRSFVSLCRNGNGPEHMLAIEGSTGYIYGWGMNNQGQVGDGTTINRSSPVLVSNSRSYLQVHAVNNSSAALGADGNTYYWGSNAQVQFGNGGGHPTLGSPLSIPKIFYF